MIILAIQAVAPHANATAWAEALSAEMEAAEITTVDRVAMFIGQCAVESSAFQQWEEQLDYMTPQRLCAVWPRIFPTESDASPFVGRPMALANRVYAGRLGNGDEASGDGWRFRGRGLIQITGRANYTALAKYLNRPLDEVVDWCASVGGAAVSAVWFWKTRASGALNHLADAWNIPAVTVLVNGGDVNHAARREACEAARAAVKAYLAPERTADDLNAAELANLPQGELS